MAGIAKITLVGNLGRDPETRYTPNGKMNVTVHDGREPAFHRSVWAAAGADQLVLASRLGVVWPRSLDRLAQNGYLAKGKQVYVDGRLEAREYQDQQGQTRTSLDVTANELQLLGSRADGEGGFGGGGLALARARVRRLDGRRAERTRRTSPGRSKKSPGTMASHRSRESMVSRLG